MRVIAGRWKGRKLRAGTGQAVRPTTDRVKEALFSLLGPEIPGAVVMDLCCGSGGLGIEAMSRGAAEVVFVDAAAASLDLLRANLAHCDAAAADYRTLRSDVRQWLRRWPGDPRRRPLVILADPPYDSGLAGQLADLLTLPAICAALSVAVLEHGAGETLAIPAGFSVDARRYGTTVLSVFRPHPEDPEDPRDH